jgi:hypothetical protein
MEVLVIENVNDPDVDRDNVVDKDSLRAGRFSAPVQSCPGAQPASYKMGIGSLSRR